MDFYSVRFFRTPKQITAACTPCQRMAESEPNRDEKLKAEKEKNGIKIVHLNKRLIESHQIDARRLT